MRKASKMLIVVAALSLIVMIINFATLISKRNWVKVEAVVTFVLTPDGVACGDYTDPNGIVHTSEGLFSSFKYQQLRGFKKVDQEDIDKIIGKRITLLYNPEADEETNGYVKTVYYDRIIRNILWSSSFFAVSLILFFILRKKVKNTQ